jgi:ribosomal protein S18 acetylase RimI-like enzyme
MPAKAKNRGTRHPRQEDAQRVLDLVQACDTAEYGEPDTDMQDLLYDWQQVDLAQDALLIEDSVGDVIAYAAVIPYRDGLRLDLYLHPNGGADNLKASLLGDLEKRARSRLKMDPELHSGHLMTHLAHRNARERDFFERAGYRPVCYYFQMRHMQEGPPEPFEWPAGISVRTFNPGADDQPVYEFVQEAFRRPDRDPATIDDWRDFMMRPGSFLPELWKLAFTGKQLVGTCLSFEYEEEGWVRQLAVASELRRQGLGSALLRDAFRMFYMRGQARVALSVASDNPNAIHFYQQLGMTLVRQYDEYIKGFDELA